MTPKQSRTRTAGRIALATVVSAGLLLTACGDDDEASASGEPETTEAETSGSEASPLDDATSTVDDGVLTVELVDFGFEGLPESVPAGTKLAVENTSLEEFHELVAFRLPDDEERTAEELVALPEEELGALFGGPPATVLLAGPDGGEQTAAVGDGTLADPGRYVLFCSIPTGADPAEIEASLDSEGPPPEDPDAGPPHFVHGMYADLVVE